MLWLLSGLDFLLPLGCSRDLLQKEYWMATIDPKDALRYAMILNPCRIKARIGFSTFVNTRGALLTPNGRQRNSYVWSCHLNSGRTSCTPTLLKLADADERGPKAHPVVQDSDSSGRSSQRGATVVAPASTRVEREANSTEGSGHGHRNRCILSVAAVLNVVASEVSHKFLVKQQHPQHN